MFFLEHYECHIPPTFTSSFSEIICKDCNSFEEFVQIKKEDLHILLFINMDIEM